MVYQPILKPRLPILTAEDIQGYVPSSETGKSDESLRSLCTRGWLDLAKFEHEIFIERESWELYNMGVKKYISWQNALTIANVSVRHMQAFIDNGIVRLEARGRRRFVYFMDLYKMIEDEWISISQASSRLGISREQLRHDVRKWNLKVVPYKVSHLVSWEKVKRRFSELPDADFISNARARYILGVTAVFLWKKWE